MRRPLNGTQWCILLWVVRHTYGWHQPAVEFSWYKIARDLSMDRSGVVRAGTRLVKAGILRIEDNDVRIRDDNRLRQAMTNNISSDDNHHPERCQVSALFRRAKDRCKEKSKKYIKITPTAIDGLQNPSSNEAKTVRQHLADTAKPIQGKYDRLSQN